MVNLTPLKRAVARTAATKVGGRAREEKSNNPFDSTERNRGKNYCTTAEVRE